MDVPIQTIPIGTVGWGPTVNSNFSTIGEAFKSALSLVSVIAGGSTGSLSSLIFDNAGGVSFGLNASTITATRSGFTAQENLAVSAGNGEYTFQTLNMVDTEKLLWSTSSDGLRGAVLNNGTTISSYENQIGGLINTVSALISVSISDSHCAAFQLPLPGSFSFLRLPVSNTALTFLTTTSAGSANASGQAYSTWYAVAYKLGTGASSKSLVSVASGSCGATILNSISVAANGTQYSNTVKFSQYCEGNLITASMTAATSDPNWYGMGAGAMTKSFASLRWQDINFNNSLSAGPYWMVIGLQTSASSNSTKFSCLTIPLVYYQRHYCIGQPTLRFATMGNTDLTGGGVLGAGHFSSNALGTFPEIALSNIRQTLNSNPRPYFQLLRSS